VAQGLAPLQPQAGWSTPKAQKNLFRTLPCEWPVQKVGMYILHVSTNFIFPYYSTEDSVANKTRFLLIFKLSV
jgi:hypothetical protein